MIDAIIATINVRSLLKRSNCTYCLPPKTKVVKWIKHLVLLYGAAKDTRKYVGGKKKNLVMFLHKKVSWDCHRWQMRMRNDISGQDHGCSS